MPKYTDSFEKIVGYLQVVARHNFVFKKKIIEPPKRLFISRLFFRDFICPENCGACCPQFSLDYFEGTDRYKSRIERFPKYINSRIVSLNGVEVEIYSDMQVDNEDFFCRNLDKKTGRCKIHGVQPFSCDFEPRKLFWFPSKGSGLAIKRIFSRGWNMKNVRGVKGVSCKFKVSTIGCVEKDIVLLNELDTIAQKFKIKTYIPEVIKFLQVNKAKLENGLIPKKNILIH